MLHTIIIWLRFTSEWHYIYFIHIVAFRKSIMYNKWINTWQLLSMFIELQTASYCTNRPLIELFTGSPHDTKHLLQCPANPTELGFTSLWTKPMPTAIFIGIQLQRGKALDVTTTTIGRYNNKFAGLWENNYYCMSIETIKILINK